ncbi:MAG: sulfur carrier protein ThiS [Verrucomicrobia bacterium]|nr:sulfur carrier protein ThiS [Verrucomicrobiota bacterium]MBV8483556.1 sulfur carrier protein ThiS [Verrucomicrobiota bacterium]
MTARINGESRTVPDGSTIANLLASFDLPAKNVLVEHNGEPVARDNFSHQTIREDDRIEIISMVAGG